MTTHSATVQIIADSPQEAGARLMQEAVLPLLHRVNNDIPPDLRPMLWAGAMASLAGGMASALEPAAVVLIMRAIEPMLGELKESAQREGLPH